jgi:hypothetical protein
MERFLECLCEQHMIEIVYWADPLDDIDITFWTPVGSEKWGRIRWALYVLRHGYDNQSSISLKKEDALRLSNLLKGVLKK